MVFAFQSVASPQAKATILQNALTDLYQLSSAEMEGREHNTVGSQRARQYLTRRFAEIGLLAFDAHPDYLQHFEMKRSFERIKGVNVIGYLPSSAQHTNSSASFIVITAHYDHLGKVGGKTFFGADDNASGVAAMLAMAGFVQSLQLHHSIIFLATDAEEGGLYGAKAALQDFPILLSNIAFNFNLDMLAQVGNPAKIYLSGTRSTPQFETLLDDLRPRLAGIPIKLMGEHRSRRARGSAIGRTNYRRASDHAVFIDHDIPFLYLGVTEHDYYHTENDSFENLDTDQYLQVLTIAKQILIAADKAMEQAQASALAP